MGSENVWMSGAKESSVISEALGEKSLLERLWDKVWTKNISPGEDREQKKKNEVSVEKRDIWIQL